MPLIIAKDDITTLSVDAIVNAANCGLKNYARRRGGGVCGAVFRAAGHDAMQAACDAIGGCETGSAVITGGFALQAKWVIHAVGPRYSEGDPNQAALLGQCYRAALDLCESNGLSTVAFPLISSGIFGYPREEALQIATNAILSWLSDHGDKKTVYLCLVDEALYSVALNIMNGRQLI